jgi:DNA-binding NarL/FixJ family response regulator
MNEDPDLAAEAFRAGASGYLLKRSAASELQTAIREVVMHRSYVTPLVTEGLMGSMLRGPATRQAPQELTPRQREVVQLVAEGHSMKEVGNIQHRTADGVPQYADHAAAQHQDHRGVDSVRHQAPHHLNGFTCRLNGPGLSILWMATAGRNT